MDTVEKLRKLIKETGWSEYRLAKESGLSESTLHNIFRRGTVPSIPTLEAICNGLHITLSQFFAEDEMVELTPDLKRLFDRWKNLTYGQKDALVKMLDEFCDQ